MFTKQYYVTMFIYFILLNIRQLNQKILTLTLVAVTTALIVMMTTAPTAVMQSIADAVGRGGRGGDGGHMRIQHRQSTSAS